MYDTNVAWLGNYGSTLDTHSGSQQAATGARLSTFDVPQMLKFSYSYDLPSGAARRSWQHARGVGCDDRRWKTNGIWELHSGRPLSFFT